MLAFMGVSGSFRKENATALALALPVLWEDEMSNLGMGVMLNMLGGNKDSVEAFQAVKGKTITAIKIESNELIFTFTDESRMALFDNRQSCCEARWMHTDDDLDSFIGATLDDAEMREGPTKSDEWGDPTESQFLIVATSKGQFTVVNYNEHNGYYGGFWVIAKSLLPED